MFTLWLTDHALRRFAELFLDHSGNLPKHVSHILDLDGARRARRILKAVVKILPNTTRVTLPANKQWGKFMKHGAEDQMLLCAKDWTTFVIVREALNHTVVTITRPPKGKRDAEIDDSIPNPSGAVYLKDVSSIVLPYTLKSGLPDQGMSTPMWKFHIPVYFGKDSYAREGRLEKLPLQPG
jgi:hypothetical protein